MGRETEETFYGVKQRDLSTGVQFDSSGQQRIMGIWRIWGEESKGRIPIYDIVLDILSI